jgi:hypothetical protein
VGYSWEAFERDLEKLDAKYSLKQQHAVEGEARKEIDIVLTKVCPLYLQTDTSTRERIRNAFGDRRPMAHLAWRYAYGVGSNIHSAEDVNWLRQGLAAISIENARIDSRDTMVVASKLYRQAEQAGIDPQPHFEAMAEMSSARIAKLLAAVPKVIERKRTSEKSP